MATLLPPPAVPIVAPRTRRRGPMAATADPSKGAPAFRGAAIASSGDARRRWWSPLLRTILRDEAAPEEQAEQPAPEATVRRAKLTAEKARVLRREMRATEVWHDAMYHSAIASRLASAEQP